MIILYIFGGLAALAAVLSLIGVILDPEWGVCHGTGTDDPECADW